LSDRPIPSAEYQTRLAARQAARAAFSGRDRLLGVARPIVFLAACVSLWGAFGAEQIPKWSPFVLIALFFALVVWHARVLSTRARLDRAVTYYERALNRLTDKWPGQGTPGDRFSSGEHPYSADLDLFGKGSLFELLCTCRTQLGEDALAGYLLAPAAADEVRQRQAAIDELRGRVDLREDLALLGDAVRAEVEARALTTWAAEPRLFGNPLLPLGLAVVSLITLGLTIAWSAFGLTWMAPVGAVLVELAILRALNDTVTKVTAAVDRPGRHLAVLAEVLARLERESFKSDKLRALASELVIGDSSAAARIAELGRRVDLLLAQRNQMFIPFAIVLLWGPQLAWFIESWRASSGPKVARWLAAVGELEALCALSGYAFEHPADPFPELVDGPRFEATELGHPLIPESRCIRNDVALDGTLRLYLVSGSNMSGKSTLLRTVGTNVVLALAGAPVRAKTLTLSPLQIGATLRVIDSLATGASRFYAEIMRLRQLVDLTSGKLPLLFLLDEILHGTNSHDRRLGAEAVVRGLLDRGAIGLCTTHDLAIADMVESLGARATNVHFEDVMTDGKLVFDYRMRPGVVRRSNALELMRAVGLDV
jgi:hypothetical protein